MDSSDRTAIRGCFIGLFILLTAAGAAFAQAAKTEPLAKQLVAALAAAKMDSIAAPDPANPGVYVAALNIPGLQLIVVGAKYPAPDALNYKLANKAYRDVYLDLSAGGLEGKVYIEDAGADGLKVRRRNPADPLDRAEIGSRQVVFDYDFRRQKLSLDDYIKTFNTAEERYGTMLQALIAQLKKQE